MEAAASSAEGRSAAMLIQTPRRNPPRHAKTPTSFPPPPPRLPIRHSALPSNLSSTNATHPSCPPPLVTSPPALNAPPPSTIHIGMPDAETVQVYLRIRPARVSGRRNPAAKTHKGRENIRRRVEVTESLDANAGICLHEGSDSVMLVPPSSSAIRRSKVEEFNGFSHVFGQNASQADVFDKILLPRLVDLIKGKSSLVVAMGPTSAGKTHTMLGSPEDPGLVPRSLQYLFEPKSAVGSTSTKISIAMFEIYSEQGGRYEKILDLLQDGLELTLQQHLIKGLHEAFVSTAEEASSIVCSGLQRRTTASTAANHSSSRSHCIINITASDTKFSRDDHRFINSNCATLTIADLAGFERERKTGNQGVRLNESNFINNTSMVFGQCLRALLEHQKNPKKVLQKHFQYSMLTRYLKPYMEAKGNMTLIINISPCEEDYLDTAFVLKQVAPYSTIRLNLVASKETTTMQDFQKKAMPFQDAQRARKRRKVDPANSKDDKPYGHYNRETNKAVKNNSSDIYNDCRVDVSQAEPRDNMYGNVMKETVLANVNKILSENKVENSVEIAQMIFEVFEKAIEQHYDGFQSLRYRLGKYEPEPFSTTNLDREQDMEVHLLKELENMKQYCKDLEKRFMVSQSNSIVSQTEERLVDVCDPQSRKQSFHCTEIPISTRLEDSSPSMVRPDRGVEEVLPTQLHYHNYDNISESSTGHQKQISEGAIGKRKFSCSPESEIDVMNRETNRGSVTKDDIPEESKYSIQQSPNTNNMMAVIDNQVLGICSPKEISPSEDYCGRVSDVAQIEMIDVLNTSEVSLDSADKSNLQQIDACNEPLCQCIPEVLDTNQVLDFATESVCDAQINGQSLQVNDSQDEFESDGLTLQPCLELGSKSSKSHMLHKITLDNEENIVDQESLKPMAPKDIANTEATEASDPCSKLADVSSFAKGKLLALSLMEESQLPHVVLDDLDGHASGIGVVTQAVGPIGLDLEGLLDIPLSEIETELWARKDSRHSRLSELLKKGGGILDLNIFPRRFSQQRSLCIRYCLAVLCGHMNMDGKWFALSKETISSRRNHFGAIIRAKTVTEAVMHARSAFQEEARFITSLAKDNGENILQETMMSEKNLKPKTLFREAQYNNENEGYSSVRKSTAPKRRKLQPLSSLCLHSDGNKMIADFEHGHAIDDETVAETMPRKSNCLASLLVGTKR